jgi:hypothetical protein
MRAEPTMEKSQSIQAATSRSLPAAMAMAGADFDARASDDTSLHLSSASSGARLLTFVNGYQ